MYSPTVYTYICTGRPVTSSVSVWALNAERWGQVAKLEIESVGKGVGSEVRDVDWAPSMGRPYYFIAAAVGSTVQVVCIHTHTHTHTHTICRDIGYFIAAAVGSTVPGLAARLAAVPKDGKENNNNDDNISLPLLWAQVWRLDFLYHYNIIIFLSRFE